MSSDNNPNAGAGGGYQKYNPSERKQILPENSIRLGLAHPVADHTTTYIVDPPPTTVLTNDDVFLRMTRQRIQWKPLGYLIDELRRGDDDVARLCDGLQISRDTVPVRPLPRFVSAHLATVHDTPLLAKSQELSPPKTTLRDPPRLEAHLTDLVSVSSTDLMVKAPGLSAQPDEHTGYGGHIFGDLLIDHPILSHDLLEFNRLFNRLYPERSHIKDDTKPRPPPMDGYMRAKESLIWLAERHASTLDSTKNLSSEKSFPMSRIHAVESAVRPCHSLILNALSRRRYVHQIVSNNVESQQADDFCSVGRPTTDVIPTIRINEARHVPEASGTEEAPHLAVWVLFELSRLLDVDAIHEFGRLIERRIEIIKESQPCPSSNITIRICAPVEGILSDPLDLGSLCLPDLRILQLLARLLSRRIKSVLAADPEADICDGEQDRTLLLTLLNRAKNASLPPAISGPMVRMLIDIVHPSGQQPLGLSSWPMLCLYYSVMMKREDSSMSINSVLEDLIYGYPWYILLTLRRIDNVEAKSLRYDLESSEVFLASELLKLLQHGLPALTLHNYVCTVMTFSCVIMLANRPDLAFEALISPKFGYDFTHDFTSVILPKYGLIPPEPALLRCYRQLLRFSIRTEALNEPIVRWIKAWLTSTAMVLDRECATVKGQPSSLLALMVFVCDLLVRSDDGPSFPRQAYLKFGPMQIRNLVHHLDLDVLVGLKLLSNFVCALVVEFQASLWDTLAFAKHKEEVITVLGILRSLLPDNDQSGILTRECLSFEMEMIALIEWQLQKL